jgi:predicted phage terminase large subunit-like protein
MAEGLSFLEQVLRLDFTAFAHRVFQTVSPGDQFLPNWHHEAIAYELQRIETGANHRLIVNVPPRSLKSILISVAWVAWLLGHKPTMRIVTVSYSGELAGKLARDCRRVMESSWYVRLFPASRLSKRTAEHDFETVRGGGRFSTSVDGTLTGRGGDLVLIDDPMKSGDAHSEAARKRVIDFFSGTATSRLNDRKRGGIVIVMQRLHEEDLSGHLLATGGWKHLCLPAIALEDQRLQLGANRFYERIAGVPLQPKREDTASLLRQKREMGSAEFSAQYLQEPIPASGVIFKRSWLKYYDFEPKAQEGDRIVQSWDTASKDGVLNDFSVCVTARVRRNTIYVLDVYRAKLRFPRLKAKTIELARLHKAKVLLIEDAASGAQLLQVLRDEAPAGVPTPIARKPTADKQTRAVGQTHRVEAGDLLLPKEAPWLSGFLKELLGFPNTRFVDQVDALVHLMAWSRSSFNDQVIAGPIIVHVEDAHDDWDTDYPDPWGP